jgi:hypothetical protein
MSWSETHIELEGVKAEAVQVAAIVKKFERLGV